MKQIFMTVPLHGISKGTAKIDIKTEGFKGQACADATKAIEAILGRVQEDTPTSEMYDTEEQHERLNNGE